MFLDECQKMTGGGGATLSVVDVQINNGVKTRQRTLIRKSLNELSVV